MADILAFPKRSLPHCAMAVPLSAVGQTELTKDAGAEAAAMILEDMAGGKAAAILQQARQAHIRFALNGNSAGLPDPHEGGPGAA